MERNLPYRPLSSSFRPPLACHLAMAAYWSTNCQNIPDKSQCPWCPNTEHNTLHLFHQCHIASTIWDTTQLIYTACTHSLPPPYTPDPSLTPQQLRLFRSLQSAAMLTIWNAFTSRAFGHNPTLSISHILDQFLGRLLFLCTLDLQIDPHIPWTTPNNILSVISLSKSRYISPFPNINICQ